MNTSVTPPRRIALGYHPHMPEAIQTAADMLKALQRYRLDQVYSAPLDDNTLRQRVENKEFDLLIALGGDGTMLRAGRMSAPAGLPVLGINTGHAGFLAEVSRTYWDEAMPALLNGKFRIEARMMLHVQHWRDGVKLDTWDALNDVVVSRGRPVRPIRVQASVDGYTIAGYVADGLIVSTPTGSTAYALAVGGPILAPELRNILIIPIAPHLSLEQGIVLPEGACVKVTAFTRHEVTLSIDGHAPVMMNDGDEIHATGSEHTVRFVRFQDPGYFYRNLTLLMRQNPAAGIN